MQGHAFIRRALFYDRRYAFQHPVENRNTVLH